MVSREYAENGDAIIRSGTDTELIITERVLYNLPTEGPYAAYVKRGLEASNLTLLVVPDIEVLPVGLSILDGERVIIAPANQGQVPSEGPAAEVMGDDPALVAWCEDLHETYRARARSPTQQVLADLKQRLAETVPSIRSASDE